MESKGVKIIPQCMVFYKTLYLHRIFDAMFLQPEEEEEKREKGGQFDKYCTSNYIRYAFVCCAVSAVMHDKNAHVFYYDSEQ